MVTGGLTWHLISAKSSQTDRKLSADLKTLVDSAANTVRDAERKTVGLAISHDRKGDPLRRCDPRLKPCGRQVSRLPYRTPGSRWRLPLLAS
jgi:hypothetical protein